MQPKEHIIYGIYMHLHENGANYVLRISTFISRAQRLRALGNWQIFNAFFFSFVLAYDLSPEKLFLRRPSKLISVLQNDGDNL